MTASGAIFSYAAVLMMAPNRICGLLADQVVPARLLIERMVMHGPSLGSALRLIRLELTRLRRLDVFELPPLPLTEPEMRRLKL